MVNAAAATAAGLGAGGPACREYQDRPGGTGPGLPGSRVTGHQHHSG
jgi:hypothetical protein